MISTFMKIFWGCLLTALVSAISILVPWAVLFVMSMLNKEPGPMILIYIVMGTAVVVCIFWFVIASMGSWLSWFFCGVDACFKHPLFLPFGLILIWLIPAVLGGASVWCSVTGFGKIVSVVERTENYHYLSLMFLFPAIAVSQGCYLIATTVHFFKWQTCRCGRMFSIAYHMSDSSSYSDTKYKAKTKRESVGSISAGGKKLVDIQGDVTRVTKETTYTHSFKYAGKCTRCGRNHKSMDKSEISVK